LKCLGTLIVFDNIVFLHLRKCGGSSIINNIRNEKKILFGKNHGILEELPKEYRGFDIVAQVRNPLTWYTSWYSFNRGLFEYGSRVPPFMRLLLWDYTINDFASIDLFISRAANLQRFFSSEILRLSELRMEFAGLEKPSWVSAIESSVPYWKPEEFNGSLYQYFVDRMGVLTTTTFRVEDQKEELKEVLGIGNIPYLNRTKKVWSPSEESLKLVIDEDERLFKYFGYRREL